MSGNVVSIAVFNTLMIEQFLRKTGLIVADILFFST